MLVTLLALALAASDVKRVHAQPSVNSSRIACTNLDPSASAYIQLEYYQQDSDSRAALYADTMSLASGKSRVYFSLSQAPSSFKGAVIAASDRKIACTSHLTKDNYRLAESNGIETQDSTRVGATLYATQFIKNLVSGSDSWNSTITAHNAGWYPSAITITFRDRFGNTSAGWTYNTTLPGYSTKALDLASHAPLPNNFLGGATISGEPNSRLTATIVFYNNGSATQRSQFQSYNATRSGENELRGPRFLRNYYGYNSGLAIANIGGNTANVNIAFLFGPLNNSYSQAYSIAAGNVLHVYAPNIPGLNGVDNLAVSDRYGNIKINSDQPIISTVNEDNRGSCVFPASCPTIPAYQIGQGSTYLLMPPALAKRGISFPFVRRNIVPNSNPPVPSTGLQSGIQVADVSGLANSCTIKFSGSSYTENFTLSANGSKSWFLPNVGYLPNTFEDSARVECTYNVIGISNSSDRSTNVSGDTASQTDGIPYSP
jgi:hypothetical protein